MNTTAPDDLTGVVSSLDRNITSADASMVDTNVYCTADCRNFVNRAVIACGNAIEPDVTAAFLALSPFICTNDVENNVTCFNFINSPQFAAVNDAFTESGVCPDEIPAGQTCSSACQRALQNFAIDGGCCIDVLFGIATREHNVTIYGLSLSQCPVDLSQGTGGTCTEIGVGAGNRRRREWWRRE